LPAPRHFIQADPFPVSAFVWIVTARLRVLTSTGAMGEVMVEGGELGSNAELSSSRTVMSLERTALSAEITLLSIIRAAAALIFYGFIYFQFFYTLAGISRTPPHSSNFALGLVLLGAALLGMGIFQHAAVMHGLRVRRDRLLAMGLLTHAPDRRAFTALAGAGALLAFGVIALCAIAFQFGPFI
jgi:uncharacterized membrane protein YidH (DUF202 family)